jgi:hypothetical protein
MSGIVCLSFVRSNLPRLHTIKYFTRKQYALVCTSMFINLLVCCQLSLYDCRLLGVGVERLD